MALIDDYVTDVLMRDLVGHDKRPVSFLVYLWLAAEQQRRSATVQISYQELAESIGISKSAAQAAVAWLRATQVSSRQQGDGDGDAEIQGSEPLEAIKLALQPALN